MTVGTQTPTLNERLSWDEYGLGIAEAVSKRSSCTRRQVGAVVMDTDHRIVSTGYNGTAVGELNCVDGGCPRGLLSYDEQPAFAGYETSKCLHAEANALIRAGEKAVGGTLVVTCPPCHECARLATAARVARIIYPEILLGEKE